MARVKRGVAASKRRKNVLEKAKGFRWRRSKNYVAAKEAVLKAAKGFTGIFKTLTIRAKFGSEDQAMIVYEVEIPGLTKKLHAASLLSFREGLISQIELFYDSKGLK